ncbi:MAG: hypothetical protein LBU32_01315 [Clostridiales bacterium]|jgi:hypothetical protein|nr:hypothetical protein [Clostridiales bacterium]
MGEFRFSFSEEDLGNANGQFAEFVAEMNEHVIKFIQGIRDKKDKTHYNPIAVHGQNIVNHYNDNAIPEIKRICEEWHDGEASYLNIAKIRHVGADAEEVATSFGQSLLESINENLKPIDEITTEGTERPEIVEQDFEDLGEELKSITDAIQDTADSAKTNFEKSAEENSALSGLLAPVSAISSFLSESFCKIAENSVRALIEQYNEDEGKMVSLTQYSAQNIAAKAQTNAVTISDELMAEIENLFSE